MANVLQLRGMPFEEVQFFPISADIVIAVGDFVWWDGTTVRAASAFTWDTSDVITRKQFKQKFAGIAKDAHRSGDAAGLFAVVVSAEIIVTLTSGTPSLGTMIAPEDASSLLIDQKAVLVQDPAEAIGVVSRARGASSTEVYAIIAGTISGVLARLISGQHMTYSQYISVAATGDKITNIPAWKLFGGAVEILALGFIEVTACSDETIMNLEKSTTDFAALTIPTSGGAIGRYTEADMSADASRVLGPTDNISLEVSDAGAASSAGIAVIRYRRLS